MSCIDALAYLCDTLPCRKLKILMNSKEGFVLNFNDNFDFIKSLFFLKNHTLSLFSNLVDILSVHFPSSGKFELIFILNSLNFQKKILLTLKALTTVYSVGSFFSGAFWAERECWDMHGLRFLSHVDLRRILTDYGFSGHPLKKDFPLTGYLELRYDELSKSLIYEVVELSQELREFKFANPWSKR